ncbi:MAG TPA: IS21 family transposase [Gaiellaceae bacterium]|nr:IS21 family transposase [Gaiellaceae bacterium]
MIDPERRVLLKHYLEEGVPVAVLARRLKIGRRTIQRWIAKGETDRDVDIAGVRYTSRPERPGKLDPYKALIEERLNQYPELTAVRLSAEITAAGYTGGMSQLRAFVRQIRPTPLADPVVRFETPPAHQAQVDFAEFRFPWGKRYALLVVLGYSRLLWLRFYERQTIQTLFTGIEESFRFFGGVPRELLFDQMKAVITRDERARGGRLVENMEFLRFASHWGFKARACRPYRAKTKGKVERPIRYVRQSFVYGREFVSDGDLGEQCSGWLSEVANARVHQTTKELPTVRFERDERALLRPLAERSYKSLVLAPVAFAPVPPQKHAQDLSLPRIDVEQRSLTAYARLVGSAR